MPFDFDNITKYRAIFKPKNIDTLKPECFAYIGKEMIVRAVWIEDSGPYKGQWIFQQKIPDNLDLTNWMPCFLPEEDFEFLND